MALPLGNLYLHLDTTNIASNPTSGTTWFDLTANNVDFPGESLVQTRKGLEPNIALPTPATILSYYVVHL